MLWKNNNMNETFTYIKILYNSDKLIYSLMQEMKQQQQKQREIFVCLRTCFEMTIRPQKSEFKMKYILEIYKYNQTLIKNSFFSYIFEKLLYIND